MSVLNLKTDGTLTIEGNLVQGPDQPYFAIDTDGNILAKSFVIKPATPQKLMSFGRDGVTLYGTLNEKPKVV